MLKTAIIGITGYGTEHLRLLLRGHALGRLSPQAAVVINPEEAQEGIAALTAIGCRIYDSVERMWAEERGNIDLCMIPTAISTHYRFTRMALDNGAHVFLEKPSCATLQDLVDLQRIAAASRREVCVGFQDLYNPQVRLIKAKLLAGEFGRVHSIRGWGSWPRGIAYFKRNRWAGQLRDDGGWVLDSPVNNAMAHFLNLMLYWAGATADGFGRPLSLEGDLYRVQPVASFDTASLRLRMESGAEVFFAVTHSGEAVVEPVIRITGDKGWLEWNHFGMFRYVTQQDEGVLQQPWIHVIRDGMMDAVCQRIETGSGYAVTLADTVPHTLCVNALHDASAIQPIPAGLQRKVDNGKGTFIRVEGMNFLLQQAFEQSRLLKELPAPWPAAQGRLLDLRDYAAFGGGYHAAVTAPAAQ